MSIERKVAVITGASQGIGAALVKAFRARDYRVIATARSIELSNDADILVVRGDIRTYKIHLGSGNILMEPNDQYLCIVPSRGSGVMGKEKLFVPFEGDQTLSIILSKAFLLAEDKKISDPSITRQIKR